MSLNEIGVKLCHGAIDRVIEAGGEFAAIDLKFKDGGFGVTVGLRLGALAAHRVTEARRGWRITHLPTSGGLMSQSGYFDDLGDAAEALLKIAALRDWSATPSPSELAAERGQVWEIQFMAGGREP